MHVIICCGGRMSTSLAVQLAAEKHDVVIIEKDAAKAEELAETVNAAIIHGDATDVRILEEAGLEKADIVVSLSPSESENLLVCMNAKKRRSCKTAARIERAESEEIFKNLGIDTVIYPEKAAAHYLEELITKPEAVDLAYIDRGAATILEFEVKRGSRVAGRKVRDVEYPKGSLIIAVYDGKNLTIPDPKSVLSSGAKVLVLARNGAITRVRKLFSARSLRRMPFR